MTEQRIQRLNIGDKIVTPPRVITKSDIETFCAITGMVSPLFSSDAYVKSSKVHQEIGLKGAMAPGQLVMGIMMGNVVLTGAISDVIVQLATNNVKYTAPVYAYDLLRTEAEIMGKRVTKAGDRVIIDWKWEVKNQDNVTVIQGDNTCMFQNV